MTDSPDKTRRFICSIYVFDTEDEHIQVRKCAGGTGHLLIQEEILRLKEERHAIILAHNYQPGEVQDIADLTGDSLELSRAAATMDGDIIVFCGVDFMAETAAVISPVRWSCYPHRTPAARWLR